jgi:hypothetical protein
MRTLALSIGVFLALAGSARAASVSVSGFAPGPYDSGTLSGATIAVNYDAAAGETNDLVISRDGTGDEYLVFTDTGASSVSFGAWPVSPCTRGDDPTDVHVVRCPLQGATARLTITPATATTRRCSIPPPRRMRATSRAPTAALATTGSPPTAA